MTEPLRASLMVRLSNAAGESNLSKEGMLADLRSLAVRLNARVVGEHIDDGISGAVRDRPGFLNWLDDGTSGRANLILAWSGDRLTREGINAAAMVLDVVEGKDVKTGKVVRSPVRFVSFDDGLDSQEGDAFRWRFVIAAEVARGERNRAVSRNLARARRMKEAGIHSGNTPYGYRKDPHKVGALVIDEVQAAAVRECARRVLDGQQLGQIARWMNANGTPPNRAAQWSRNTLLQILTNAASAGQPLVPGAPAREPVIGYATLVELRKILRNPRTTAERKKRSPSALLAGLLICHDCKSALRSTSGRYVCMSRGDGKVGCSGAVSIGRAAADKVVEDGFLGRWGRLVRFREETVVGGVDERDAVELAIAALMGQIQTAFTPELGAELGRLQAERAELAAAPVTTTRRRVSTGRSWADEWADATHEDRRDMLRSVFASVTCYPGWGKPDKRLTLEPREDIAELTVDAHGDVA